MLGVDEAIRAVLEHTPRGEAVTVPLAEALGLVLAEDVASDIDSPPYDKAMVDGYAVRAADVGDGRALEVVEDVTAGRVPRRPVGHGQATRIMTGAPLPEGADAVVMLEQTREEGGAVRFAGSGHVRAGQNLMRRAQAMRAGEVVLAAGSEVGPAQIGLLAEVGRAQVRVLRRPTVAVLSTGDELLDPSEAAYGAPGPGQIRNSNGPMLVAQAMRAGAEVRYLGIARDTRESLRERLVEGLRCDVLVLSGGVSAGKLDLVPQTLGELGVRQVFHKVNVKPGKPVWFGVASGEWRVASRETRAESGGARLVFGLPGNPVSALVCFELFAKPAVRKLLGYAQPVPEVLTARLAEAKHHRSDRPTYHPAVIERRADGLWVRALAWQGSPDLRSASEANGFALFAAGERRYGVGEVVEVVKAP